MNNRPALNAVFIFRMEIASPGDQHVEIDTIEKRTNSDVMDLSPLQQSINYDSENKYAADCISCKRDSVRANSNNNLPLGYKSLGRVCAEIMSFKPLS